jgi:hypothetical protein
LLRGPEALRVACGLLRFSASIVVTPRLMIRATACSREFGAVFYPCVPGMHGGVVIGGKFC